MKIYELQNLLTPSLPATTGSILEPLDSFLYRAMSSPNSAVHHCDFKPTNPSTRKEGRNEGRQEKIYSPECKRDFKSADNTFQESTIRLVLLQSSYQLAGTFVQEWDCLHIVHLACKSNAFCRLLGCSLPVGKTTR